jgi:hypothetical protein
MNKLSGLFFVALSVLVSIVFLVMASKRDLTGLENTLLQIFSLGFGLLGSYIMGKESARETAKDIIKPHARSAFRRLLSLYKSLSRLAFAIQAARSSVPQNPEALAILDRLDAIVTEQIGTADDALEDWNDVVPEELANLRAQLIDKPKLENGNG